MQARAFRLFLLFVLSPSAALAQQTAPQANASTDRIKMSAAEQAVWEKEEAYWRFVKTKDREAYAGLWDERFVGWPRLEARPIHKDRSFGSFEGRKLLDYKAEPLSVREYGESVVITLYRVTMHSASQAGADERTIAARITHTWMKMPQGWQIVGGMSAEDKPSVLQTSSEPKESASAEAELRAFMAELRKASIEGDLDTVANSMTDDYVQTDINGYRQDKTTWLNEYFRPLADLIKAGKFHWDEYERKNLQFRFYGDCAIVTGDLQAKGTGARFGPQHTWVADPNATFGGTLHFTHVYIKRNGKWMLAALHNQMPLAPANAAK